MHERNKVPSIAIGEGISKRAYHYDLIQFKGIEILMFIYHILSGHPSELMPFRFFSCTHCSVMKFLSKIKICSFYLENGEALDFKGVSVPL